MSRTFLLGAVLAVLVVLVVLVVAIGIRSWATSRSAVEAAIPPEVQEVAPFVRFDAVGGSGWIGQLPSDWPGFGDREVRAAACATLLERLKPSGTQTVLLTGPEGDPNLECGGN